MQSIAQAGLAYSKDKYDIERFEQIRGLAVEIMSEYTDVGPQKIRELFASEEGYQTPKIDVRAIVPRAEQILLVREQTDGRWALPGGWADVGLSLKENVEKEVLEESGLTTKAVGIVAVLDRQKQHGPPFPYSVYKIFVLCEGANGSFRDNAETDAARFFDESTVPPLSLTRNSPEQIAMCYEFARNPGKPAVFD